MQIPESVRDLIANTPQAHLTTLNPNGSPQVTLVWVGIEDGEFVIGHMGEWQKVKNIRRNPNVALSMLGLNDHRNFTKTSMNGNISPATVPT